MVDCGDDIRKRVSRYRVDFKVHLIVVSVDLFSVRIEPARKGKEIDRRSSILYIKSERKVRLQEDSKTAIETTMGIVSSTLASLAFQLAWNCQRLLDPQYRCLEGQRACEVENQESVKHGGYLESDKRSNSSSSANSKSSETRSRRRLQGRQMRYRKRRPASFDTALIVNYSENHPVVHVNTVVTSTPTPNPSPLGRPRPQFWDVTSSSGCSSDSGSYLDSDSELDERLNEAFIKKSDDCSDEEKERFAMSAEEEAALRMTVGRGHFSRSKKDRFLNHLRLEKRLNGLSNTFCGGSQRGHGRYLGRRYSGDLYRVTY